MPSTLTLPSSPAHPVEPARAIAIDAREDCESRLRSLWPLPLDEQPNEKAITYQSDDDSHGTLSLEEEPSQAEQDFRQKVGLYKAAALSLHYAGEDRGQRPNNFKFNVGIYDKRRKDLESELERTTTYDVIEDVLNRLDEAHCAANYRNASCSLYTDERDIESFNTRDGEGSRANTSTGSRTLTAECHLRIQWQRFEKDGTMPTNLMARKAAESVQAERSALDAKHPSRSGSGLGSLASTLARGLQHASNPSLPDMQEGGCSGNLGISWGNTGWIASWLDSCCGPKSDKGNVHKEGGSKEQLFEGQKDVVPRMKGSAYSLASVPLLHTTVGAQPVHS